MQVAQTSTEDTGKLIWRIVHKQRPQLNVERLFCYHLIPVLGKSIRHMLGSWMRTDTTQRHRTVYNISMKARALNLRTN